MVIPTKQERDAEMEKFASCAADEFRRVYNALDTEKEALSTYGIGLEIDSDHKGLALKHGDFELATLRLSKGNSSEVFLNEFVSVQAGRLSQQKFSDPAKAASQFQEMVPTWVEQFERKRRELEFLGLI